MGAGFELQAFVHALTSDLDDHFLVAAELGLVGRHDLVAPAAILGVAQVHAQQIASEQACLITAGAGADLEKHIGVVVGVLGDQQLVQFDFERIEVLARVLRFLLRHGAHLGVVFAHQRFGVGDGVLAAAITLEAFDHRTDLGVFARQCAITLLIVDHCRHGQHAVQFSAALDQGFQFT